MKSLSIRPTIATCKQKVKIGYFQIPSDSLSKDSHK